MWLAVAAGSSRSSDTGELFSSDCRKHPVQLRLLQPREEPGMFLKAVALTLALVAVTGE